MKSLGPSLKKYEQKSASYLRINRSWGLEEKVLAKNEKTVGQDFRKPLEVIFYPGGGGWLMVWEGVKNFQFRSFKHRQKEGHKWIEPKIGSRISGLLWKGCLLTRCQIFAGKSFIFGEKEMRQYWNWTKLLLYTSKIAHVWCFQLPDQTEMTWE